MADISWEAPEYEHRRKGAGWYWSTIAAAVVLIVVAVWQKNFLFGVFAVIAEILVLFWGEKPPRIVKFSIKPGGVEAGGKRYSYADMREFAETGGVGDFERFILYPKNRARSSIHILAPKNAAAKIGAELAARLPKAEAMDMVDALEEMSGF